MPAGEHNNGDDDASDDDEGAMSGLSPWAAPICVKVDDDEHTLSRLAKHRNRENNNNNKKHAQKDESFSFVLYHFTMKQYFSTVKHSPDTPSATHSFFQLTQQT